MTSLEKTLEEEEWAHLLAGPDAPFWRGLRSFLDLNEGAPSGLILDFVLKTGVASGLPLSYLPLALALASAAKGAPAAKVALPSFQDLACAPGGALYRHAWGRVRGLVAGGKHAEAARFCRQLREVLGASPEELEQLHHYIRVAWDQHAAQHRTPALPSYAEWREEVLLQDAALRALAEESGVSLCSDARNLVASVSGGWVTVCEGYRPGPDFTLAIPGGEAHTLFYFWRADRPFAGSRGNRRALGGPQDLIELRAAPSTLRTLGGLSDPRFYNMVSQRYA